MGVELQGQPGLLAEREKPLSPSLAGYQFGLGHQRTQLPELSRRQAPHLVAKPDQWSG